MALLEKHNTLLLGIWKIEESEEELLSKLSRQDAYSEFIENCKAGSRRMEWLATRVLLKELLGEELEIAHFPDGAPYLPARPDLSISISHTKGFIAIYCKENEATGIDIEYYSTRVLKIKEKFMSEEELKMIDPSLETDTLLVCWCAKETLFKLIRQEEVDFRSQLHIRPFVCENQGKITVQETKTPQQAVYELNYRVTPDFVLTFN